MQENRHFFWEFFPQHTFFFSNNLNVYLYIDSVILIGAVDMWIKIKGHLLTEYTGELSWFNPVYGLIKRKSERMELWIKRVNNLLSSTRSRIPS